MESRMRGNSHVRFGAGDEETCLGDGARRFIPTLPGFPAALSLLRVCRRPGWRSKCCSRPIDAGERTGSGEGRIQIGDIGEIIGPVGHRPTSASKAVPADAAEAIDTERLWKAA